MKDRLFAINHSKVTLFFCLHRIIFIVPLLIAHSLQCSHKSADIFLPKHFLFIVLISFGFYPIYIKSICFKFIEHFTNRKCVSNRNFQCRTKFRKKHRKWSWYVLCREYTYSRSFVFSIDSNTCWDIWSLRCFVIWMRKRVRVQLLTMP